MAKKQATPDHPTESTSSRFPLDRLLRSSGFSIHSRKKGEPTWVKGGNVFTQSQALKQLNQLDVDDATYEQILIGEGFE